MCQNQYAQPQPFCYSMHCVAMWLVHAAAERPGKAQVLMYQHVL